MTPIVNFTTQGNASALINDLETAGFLLTIANGVPSWINDNQATAGQAFIDSWVGPLAYVKMLKQADLDAFFDAHFDLRAFIRAGTTTGLTGANIGTFLATITNNYRTLRAAIAAAISVSAVQAINVQSGWPSNP